MQNENNIFIEELLNQINNKVNDNQEENNNNNIMTEFLSAILLGGLSAIEESLKEQKEQHNTSKTTKKNKYSKNESSSSKSASYNNKEINEKKVIGVHIIESDLDQEMEQKLNFSFNVIEFKNDKNRLFYDIALPGFDAGDVLVQKIKTVKDKNGNKIGKAIYLELDRREEELGGDLNYLLKQFPEYLKVEFMFFDAKRIDKIDIVNGILMVGVKY